MGYLHKGLIMTLIVGLTSCVYIVTAGGPAPALEPPKVTHQCPPMADIKFDPLPGIPVLSASDLRNKDASDTILINKIQELRDYVRTQQERVNEARLAQLRRCL